MEQNGVSIIAPSNFTENSVTGKTKGPNISVFKENKVHNSEKEALKASWLKKLMREDGTIWDTALLGLAEMLGTAMLVFIGCSGCTGSLGPIPNALQVSFAFGLTVMAIVQCFGHISQAHINPAVTIGSMVLGKKSLPVALVYLLGQIIGSILGYGLLKIITPMGLLHNGDPETMNEFCVTKLHPELSLVQGFIVEVLATAILMLVVCGMWDVRNEKLADSCAIKIGLTVVALSLAFGPYTGCSMNPVRSLGPAVWNNQWANHWIYWVGPFTGAFLSSFVYRSIFWPKKYQTENEIIMETVALNSVESQKAEQN